MNGMNLHPDLIAAVAADHRRTLLAEAANHRIAKAVGAVVRRRAVAPPEPGPPRPPAPPASRRHREQETARNSRYAVSR